MVGSRRIRLSDHRGRDAVVILLPVTDRIQNRYQDTEGRQVHRVRRIRSTVDTSIESLLEKYSDPDDLSHALVTGDPELDMELSGRAAGSCDRFHIDADGNLIYAPSIMEVRYDSSGIEEARRPITNRPANLVTAVPPVWSGVLIQREDAVRRYAFTRAYQVVHSNALEYDFLLSIASYLDERRSMVQVGTGRQGRGPLRTQRNGPRYRGFLDGRIQGDAMRLVLYLSVFELAASEGVNR
ncbi:MAG: hypothetical protein ACYC27_08395 [Armatimonadota bacterium]